jgi:hypothetical protein
MYRWGRASVSGLLLLSVCMRLRARALGMFEGLWAITMLPDVGVGMVTVMSIRLSGFVCITEERWVVN